MVDAHPNRFRTKNKGWPLASSASYVGWKENILLVNWNRSCPFGSVMTTIRLTNAACHTFPTPK